MEAWQNIYTTFDPVAFNIGSVAIHWYGIMYATALLSAIFFAHWLIKKDKLPITKDQLDSYIWWVEIGVILGARLGYILFYDPNTIYYITNPLQIFNPFDQNGNFVGISGMSYHGALIGFVISSVLWCRKNKITFLFVADIAVIAVSFGYIFGRIGNFLNKELVGRVTEQPWGIYVDGILRHPSALYEAILEGLIIFIILFTIRTKKQFEGQIAILYVILYSFMRIIAEIFREPDVQLGFLMGTSWLTMGMLISFSFVVCVSIFYFIYKKNKL
jgi:phosphatidylglycerol:prolipoprotein diacylglycerol transferase